MSRYYPNWISAFLDYSSYSEAPDKMRRWTAISTVAGALRRKVWISQGYFSWHCNMFVIFVAKPGIVSKSTTVDVGMNFLRQVPGIKFGPSSVTWQALVTLMRDSTEEYALPETNEFRKMSALTIVSSEFGNLVNPRENREMLDTLISLWDCPPVFMKTTKKDGAESIECPWLNIIACTTPSWIAENFPRHMVGGGFSSRCLFIYVEEKAKYVAYPGLDMSNHSRQTELSLIQDLEHISLMLAGEYSMTREAIDWGKIWYEEHYRNRPKHLDEAQFGGYIARKQTHIHKLAMVLAAAKRDRLVITQDDLSEANGYITELEADMPLVFNLIGRTDLSLQTERFLDYVKKHGEVEYSDAYRYVHNYFPDVKQFELILEGALKAKFIGLSHAGGKTFIRALRT